MGAFCWLEHELDCIRGNVTLVIDCEIPRHVNMIRRGPEGLVRRPSGEHAPDAWRRVVDVDHNRRRGTSRAIGVCRERGGGAVWEGSLSHLQEKGRRDSVGGEPFPPATWTVRQGSVGREPFPPATWTVRL